MTMSPADVSRRTLMAARQMDVVGVTVSRRMMSSSSRAAKTDDAKFCREARCAHMTGGMF